MTFYSSNTHWIRGDFSPLSPNSDENEIQLTKIKETITKDKMS